MKIKDFYELSVPLVLDGGLASELERTHGKNLLTTNLWSSSCLYQDPEAIREVHLSYYRAGADIATTCSYQTPIESFIKEGFTYQESIELIQKSVHIAIEARDKFWKEYNNNKNNQDNQDSQNNQNNQNNQDNQNNKNNDNQGRMKPMISLSLGPFGAILSDRSEYSGNYNNKNINNEIINFEYLKNFHKKKLNIFKSLINNIDFIIFETIPSYLEAKSIYSLLKEENLNIPCIISFSCKDEEKISDGELFINCIKLFKKMNCVVSIGINCTNPRYIENLIKIARNELDNDDDDDDGDDDGNNNNGNSDDNDGNNDNIGKKKFIVCYPDGNVEWNSEKRCYNYNEIGTLLKEFENYFKNWLKISNSKIILGGCCGTTPDHIRCIRNIIDNSKK